MLMNLKQSLENNNRIKTTDVQGTSIFCPKYKKKVANDIAIFFFLRYNKNIKEKIR